MSKNKQWASKLGFIMATAGAAIGLGNLWKFPYLMGKNGGFPFLVAYLFFIVLLGLPVMITEMSLGRKTRHDPVQAYADIHPHARIVGIFGVLAAFIILSYYSVIGGWILKYIASYVTTAAAPDFDAFIGSSEPVIWHIVFMAATIAVCYFGINGIEKASKLMMPMLLVLLFVIIFRSVTLPGSFERTVIYLQPDFSAFTLSSVSAALGQVFYSAESLHGCHDYLRKLSEWKGKYSKKLYDHRRSGYCDCGSRGYRDLSGSICLRSGAGTGTGLIFGTRRWYLRILRGELCFAILFFALVFSAAVTSAIAPSGSLCLLCD